MSKPLVVNLFGAPCAGKSTMALGIAYHLKCRKLNAELATEYAKDMTFDERWGTLRDQIYIFAKQRARIERLVPHCDVIVTDCPVLLGANYYPELFPDSFRELLLWSFNQHDTLNIFLNRVQEYQTTGRRQDEAESDQIAVEMKDFLRSNAVNFIELTGDENGLHTALDLIDVRMSKIDCMPELGELRKKFGIEEEEVGPSPNMNSWYDHDDCSGCGRVLANCQCRG